MPDLDFTTCFSQPNSINELIRNARYEDKPVKEKKKIIKKQTLTQKQHPA